MVAMLSRSPHLLAPREGCITLGHQGENDTRITAQGALDVSHAHIDTSTRRQSEALLPPATHTPAANQKL